MNTMPAGTHVAVTVSDLAFSEPWYTRALGVEPALDEDTGPFRHVVYQLGATLLGLHGFPDLASADAFEERSAPPNATWSSPGVRSSTPRIRLATSAPVVWSGASQVAGIRFPRPVGRDGRESRIGGTGSAPKHR